MAKSKYETEVMKSEECLLFLETAIENGTSVADAIEDMRMIDNLLAVERNHLLAFGTVKKTNAGHYRRGTLLSNALENVVNARANGIGM
jgi:hypothetical protein